MHHGRRLPPVWRSAVPLLRVASLSSRHPLPSCRLLATRAEMAAAALAPRLTADVAATQLLDRLAAAVAPMAPLNPGFSVSRTHGSLVIKSGPAAGASVPLSAGVPPSAGVAGARPPRRSPPRPTGPRRPRLHRLDRVGQVERPLRLPALRPLVRLRVAAGHGALVLRREPPLHRGALRPRPHLRVQGRAGPVTGVAAGCRLLAGRRPPGLKRGARRRGRRGPTFRARASRPCAPPSAARRAARWGLRRGVSAVEACLR